MIPSSDNWREASLFVGESATHHKRSAPDEDADEQEKLLDAIVIQNILTQKARL